MISGKSVLAIIPAREGSRRCPEKNWTLYKNKFTGEIDSLIGWAIKHAQGSKYIDSICISSDSDLILAYAKPPIIGIKLPPHITAPSSTSEAAIVYTLYCTTALGESQVGFHDFFVLLQPTSPLRLPSDIDACLERSAERSIGITSCSPSRRLNGAVYTVPTIHFLSTLKLGGDSYTMPDERSLDIDTPEDFLR